MTHDQGSVEEFEASWSGRQETGYSHWTRGEPVNQIQLAFRNHYTLFTELCRTAGITPSDVAEIGAGRGTMSLYYADQGCSCTLVDASPAAMDEARAAFQRAGLSAEFVVGDANALPLDSASFDLVLSIGLLEHFADVGPPLKEQVRILRPGGMLFVYVVPDLVPQVQQDHAWVNRLLGTLVENADADVADKQPLFRTSHESDHYLPVLAQLGMTDLESAGVYPLPMVSHSPDFPFTLLPPPTERVLVAEFSKMLAQRRETTGRHPWLCPEGEGQAFLVWGVRA